jgi:hypothetical protein
MSAPQLFTGDDYLRFLGLARAVLFRLPWADQEDVAQDVYVKLQKRFTDQVEELRAQMNNRAFLATALRNAAIDHHRLNKREIPESQIEHLPTQEVAPESDSSASLRDIEALLNIVFHGGHSKPHELVAFGMSVLLGALPAAAAAGLEGKTVADAAEQFVDDYAAQSGVPREKLNAHFRSLLRLQGTTDGEERFANLWSLPRLITDWVNDIRRHVMFGSPPKFSRENFRKALKQAPNRCIAWLLHDMAGWTVQQIIAASGQTVGDLAENFLEDHARQTGTTRETVLAWLGELDCGAGARRPLRDAAAPARVYSRWVDAVRRRLRSHRHEQAGLCTIFDAVPYPWKTICFLETFVLGVPASEVLRGRERATLDELVDALENGRYTAAWDGDRPEPKTVRAWLKPLRDQIRDRCIGGDRLRSFVERDDAYRGDIAETIAAWRTEVLGRIRPLFGPAYPDSELMAWRVGLLR